MKFVDDLEAEHITYHDSLPIDGRRERKVRSREYARTGESKRVGRCILEGFVTVLRVSNVLCARVRWAHGCSLDRWDLRDCAYTRCVRATG